MITYRILKEVESEVKKSEQEIAYLWGVRVCVPPTLTQQETENLYDHEVENWKKLTLAHEVLMHIHYDICTAGASTCSPYLICHPASPE